MAICYLFTIHIEANDDKKQANGDISAIEARNEKITVLCYHQLLKLKKIKCLYFFIWRQNDRDMAILLFFINNIKANDEKNQVNGDISAV